MEALAAPLASVATMAVVVAIARRAGIVERIDVANEGSDRGSLLATLGAWRPARRVARRRSLERSIAAAGMEGAIDAIVGCKLALAAGGVATLTFGFPLPGALLLALLGYRTPDLYVSRAARRRRAALDAEVPLLLDCLVAASSAGLAAPLALRRSAEAVRGPLAEECAATFASVDLGRRWKEALAALGQRLDLPDLSRCLAVLTRTEVLGVPLAASLADLASEVRAARSLAAAERARTAPVKMLFPLVFLILPAFLLLTVVPVLLSTVRSIR